MIAQNRARISLLGFIAVFALFSKGPAAPSEHVSGPPPASVPRLKCPVYVMEYHVWYRSPFGVAGQPGFIHWGDTSHIDFPSQEDQDIRDMGAVGYPLLGLYNSESPDVIRWQLRCAHTSGIDGLFVHLFPDRVTGTYLGGSKTFATILRIAQEEHIKVAVHDEVMFRAGWKAQEPAVMAIRISDFIKRFGSDPAYLKIEGHPVYAFQYWTKFIPPVDMATCLDKAEHLAGRPIHFFVMGGSDELYKRRSPSSFVIKGNSSFIKSNAESGPPLDGDWLRLNASLLELPFLRSFYPRHKFGLWAYPGFDNAPQGEMLDNSHVRSFPRQNGKILAQTLDAYNRVNPDFIILSSWNDWMENTAFEPGLRFEKQGNPSAADPYRYCRLLAKMKGKDFVPPPLPPKEEVDPLRWQSLYGIDSTPPLLKSSNYSGADNRLTATWTDSGGPVTSALLAESGDASINFLTNAQQGVHADFAAGRVISKDGFLLTNTAPLVVHLNAGPASTALSEWYLALQFQEQGPATIHISYSAQPAEVDYREFDGLTFPVAVTMSTGSLGRRRTEISLLRAANFETAKDPSITISLSPPENTPHQNVALLLRRLDLFHSLTSGKEGVLQDAGSNPNNAANFQFQLSDKPDLIFLFARDSKNNWSAPQPLSLDH